MTPDPQANCEQCGKPYLRSNTMQRVCSVRCAVRSVKVKKASDRAELRQRRDALKPRKKWLQEAQTAFNAYIRARDRGLPCICCGKPMPWHLSTPGGSIDAGHYMGTGAAPELRFVETNVSAQLKSCNRPKGTTRAKFRAGMIERWGVAEVERLEGPHQPKKYTVTDLREIRDDYRAKLKAIQP